MDAREHTKHRPTSPSRYKSRNWRSGLIVSEQAVGIRRKKLDAIHNGQVRRGEPQETPLYHTDSDAERLAKRKRFCGRSSRKSSKRRDADADDSNFDSEDISSSRWSFEESLGRKSVRQSRKKDGIENKSPHKYKNVWSNNDKNGLRETPSKKRVHYHKFGSDLDCTSDSEQSSHRMKVRRIKQSSNVERHTRNTDRRIAIAKHGINRRFYSESQSVSKSLSESERASESDGLPHNSKQIKSKPPSIVVVPAKNKYSKVPMRITGKTRRFSDSESISEGSLDSFTSSDSESETQLYTDDVSSEEAMRRRRYKPSRAASKPSLKTRHYSSEFEDTHSIENDRQYHRDVLLGLRKNKSAKNHKRRLMKSGAHIKQRKGEKHKSSKRSWRLLELEVSSSEMESDPEWTSGSDVIKKESKLMINEQDEHSGGRRRGVDFKEIAEGIDFGKCNVGQTRAKLHEFCAKHYWDAPIYNCLKEIGPPHMRMFVFAVKITTPLGKSMTFEGKEFRDHKQAKDSAASVALHWLLSEGHLATPVNWSSIVKCWEQGEFTGSVESGGE